MPSAGLGAAGCAWLPRLGTSPGIYVPQPGIPSPGRSHGLGSCTFSFLFFCLPLLGRDRKPTKGGWGSAPLFPVPDSPQRRRPQALAGGLLHELRCWHCPSTERCQRTAPAQGSLPLSTGAGSEKVCSLSTQAQPRSGTRGYRTRDFGRKVPEFGRAEHAEGPRVPKLGLWEGRFGAALVPGSATARGWWPGTSSPSTKVQLTSACMGFRSLLWVCSADQSLSSNTLCQGATVQERALSAPAREGAFATPFSDGRLPPAPRRL